MDDPRFPPVSAFPAPKLLPFKPGQSKTTSVLPERRYALGLESDVRRRRGENWLIRAVGTEGVVHFLQSTESIGIHSKTKLDELALLDNCTMFLLAKTCRLANPVPASNLFLRHISIFVGSS